VPFCTHLDVPAKKQAFNRLISRECSMETTQISPPANTLGTASGQLVLRITGNSAQAELVRVNSSKCSIGSADACTIRLNGAGVQPVHCIILRGESETVVRRWAEDLSLNGRRFDDATLKPGDLLSFANIRIEIVSDSRQNENHDAGQDQLHKQVAAAESRFDQLSEHTRILNERIRLLESQTSAKFNDPTQDALLVRLARLQDDKQELERRIAAQSVRHIEERRQWTCDVERMQSQVAKLSEYESAIAVAAQKNAPSEELKAELDSLKQQLEDQQLAFEAERQAWHEQATSNAGELEKRMQELEARQAEFEANAAQFYSEQEEARQTLELRSQELDHQSQEIEHQSQELERRSQELEARAQEIEEQAAFNVSEAPSIPSLDDEFASAVEPEDAGEFSFPSQLKLEAEAAEELSEFDEPDAAYSEEIEDHAEELAAEFTDEAEELDESFASNSESFDELQQEINELINEDDRHDSPDLSNDELMRYASQVANEVSGQVIDQQTDADEFDAGGENDAEAENREYGQDFDSEDASGHDEFAPDDEQAPAFDPSSVAHESEAPSYHEDQVSDWNTAAEESFPAADEPVDSFQAAELDPPAENRTDDSPLDHSSLEDSPLEDSLVDDSLLDDSPLADLYAEDVERGEAPAEAAESSEDTADEMLSRLQAMVGADAIASDGDVSKSAPWDEIVAAAPENSYSEADSLLDELQSIGSPASAEVADYGHEEPVAELAADEEEAHNYAPASPAEVVYESVPEANHDQLETAALAAKYGFAEETAAPTAADEYAQAEPEPYVAPVAEAQPAPQPGGEDDSIEDYMQQLLQRVGNGTTVATNEAPVSVETPSSQIEPFHDEVMPQEKPKPARTPSRPSLPLDSLTKMRELANESTRSAIKSHAATSSRANAFTNLCFLGISALATAIFFVLSKGTSMTWMLPGVLAAIATLFFTYRAVIATAKGGLTKTPKQTPKMADDPAEPAADILNQVPSQDHFAEPTQQAGMQPATQQPFPSDPNFGDPTQAAQTQLGYPPAGYAQPGYAQPSVDQYAQQPGFGQQPQMGMPATGYPQAQQPGVNPATGYPQQPMQPDPYAGHVPKQANYYQQQPGYPQAADPLAQAYPQQPMPGFDPTQQQPMPGFDPTQQQPMPGFDPTQQQPMPGFDPTQQQPPTGFPS
jgi:hypothetical protein